jgi:non-ribosomal peptide synthetase-like protein
MAERWVDELGATNLSGAIAMPFYARALGAHVAKNVDLHSIPPVTGMLTLGKGCSIEPEVDLSGHWLDGDVLHIGALKVGARSRIGARSTLAPGTSIGKGVDVSAGSAVFGEVPDEEFWSGAPARRSGAARGPWESRPRYRRHWVAAYSLTAIMIASIPLASAVLAVASVSGGLHGSTSLADLTWTALAAIPIATLVGLASTAALIWILVRCLGIGLEAGHFPVHRCNY